MIKTRQSKIENINKQKDDLSFQRHFARQSFDNFDFFLRNCIKVSHPTHGLINFSVRKNASALIDQLPNSKKLLVLQDRQVGITTLLLSKALFDAVLNPNKSILISTPHSIHTASTRATCLELFKHLPDFLKPSIEICNKWFIQFSNGSKIVFDVLSGNTGRAQSLDSIIVFKLSLAQQDIAEQALMSLLPCSTRASIVLTAPADAGLSGPFLDLWTKSSSFEKQVVLRESEK